MEQRPPIGHEEFWQNILAPNSFAYLDIIGQLPAQTANQFFGSVVGGEPAFRALVLADMAAALGLTVTTWTPTGNGVTLTINGTCKYVLIGPIVVAQYDVTWPITVDAGAAQVKSLPFAANANGLYAHKPATSIATVLTAEIAAGAQLISVLNATEGGVTNANMSTGHLAGVAVYFT